MEEDSPQATTLRLSNRDLSGALGLIAVTMLFTHTSNNANVRIRFQKNSTLIFFNCAALLSKLRNKILKQPEKFWGAAAGAPPKRRRIFRSETQVPIRRTSCTSHSFSSGSSYCNKRKQPDFVPTGAIFVAFFGFSGEAWRCARAASLLPRSLQIDALRA